VNAPGHLELLQAGELAFDFHRSSGPGGQNVNKVATAVRLRLDVRGSRVLSAGVRERLAALAAGRLTSDGVLVIEARRHRTQEGNRRDALARLDELLALAWRPPVPRRPTKPSRAARERRLEQKKGRSATKRMRGRPGGDD
jgi:ribosome-associated protein